MADSSVKFPKIHVLLVMRQTCECELQKFRAEMEIGMIWEFEDSNHRDGCDES